ncbi:MAG: hypothetical protein Q8L11_05160 [Candidatus Moranbacteria bacterium]|nr:hypothetical protein [Candidatus Moranbacteria bacterium]
MIEICKGQKSLKVVNGKSFRVTPLVCATEGNSFAQVGLGIVFEDGMNFMWGLTVPRCLVQCWRGMKIIEGLPRIEGRRTLANCWYAGARDVSHLRQPHIDELVEQFTNRQEFDKLRVGILNEMPQKINEMINICQSKNITIDINELRAEAQLGNLRVDINGLLLFERRKQQRRKTA